VSIGASLNYADLESRARQSQGVSNAAIYRMVAQAMEKYQVRGELVIDAGCGAGNLWRLIHNRFRRYAGADAVQYDGFPHDGEFYSVNLDTGAIPLPDECADAVVAVETIEHLENPRAFMRELVRLAKSGGWVIITTPNQLSLLSLLTLMIKHRFSAFQDVHYPAHLTALLEIDLKRIATECGLMSLNFEYSLQGRLILTPSNYPSLLSHLFPRAFSDNLLLIGKKPDRGDRSTIRSLTNQK
jgi:2-polyprenyl-3-methyl-5-hydroxy-6-metoxy-1,4-benzoquinol methylase